MRLTVMTDYALRLLMYLAQHAPRRCTIAEIAQAHDISQAHLTKITHQLAQAGFIQTVRGKGGGMGLAALPRDINLGAVVREMEPDFALVSCLGGETGCVLTGHCRLVGVLDQALQAFLAKLDARTLADLSGSDVPERSAARGVRAQREPGSRAYTRRPLVRIKPAGA